MPTFKYPIFILAFDRPHYLERVLVSLIRQHGMSIRESDVYLIQDGGTDAATGQVYCSRSTIARNEAAFRMAFPKGHVLTARHNLGTAANFAKAEETAFGIIGAEAALFLEDDMVLGPDYLAVVSTLIEMALAEPRIGYVAAYGDHQLSREWQERRIAELQPLAHHWAFGLTRRQWLLQKPFVDEYLSIQCGVNYRERDNDAIFDLFAGWGFAAPGTSQDVAKCHAARLTNTARINTVACFATYIGVVGQHFDQAQFDEMGYRGAVTVSGSAFNPEPPSERLLASILRTLAQAGEQDIFRSSRRSRQEAEAEARHKGDMLAQRVLAYPQEGDPRALEVLLAQGAARYPRTLDRYGHPVFAKEMTRVLAGQRRWHDAMAWAARLDALTGRCDPCASILMARAFGAAGLQDRASSWWQRVLELSPGYAEASEWFAANPGLATRTAAPPAI